MSVKEKRQIILLSFIQQVNSDSSVTYVWTTHCSLQPHTHDTM